MAYDQVAANAIEEAARYGMELDEAAEVLQSVIPSGKYMGVGRMQVTAAVQELATRLAVMESAVRAADRLVGTAGRYGNGDEITDGRKRDRETLNAAVRLLEG